MTPAGATSSISDLRANEGRIVNKLLWRLMPFLFLLYVVNYLDRINVSFAVLQMQSSLGLSDRVYGLGAGIFFGGYFFFQLPSNLAMARVGARRWMSAIMVLWGLISCCMIFVRTPHEFYGLRFVLGAAEAGFFPGIVLYMKHWFPAGGRARAVAWFMTANPVAGVVGSPISGALLGLHQFGIQGWQWMFLLEGVPAIVLAGVVLLTLKDRPEQAVWLAEHEKAWLLATLEQEHRLQFAVTQNDIAAAFLNRRVWLLIVVYFGLTSSAYGWILWLPKYIHSLSHLGSFGIAAVAVIPYLATAAAMVVTGVLSDRTGKHRAFLAGSAFAASAFLLIAAQTHSIVPGLTFVSLAMMATFSMQGPFWATGTSLMSGIAVAAGIALINSFGNLGGLFGSYVIGLTRSSGGGFKEGMLIIAAPLALAGVIALLVRSPRPQASPATNNPLQ